MDRFLITIYFLLIGFPIFSQLDAGNVMGIPRATNLAALNAINTPNPNIGSIAYNEDDSKIYVYINNVDRWVAVDLDEQDATEVLLNPALDVDESGEATITNETTVQEVIEAIAPITSTAGRIFYPPSIALDASTTGIKPDIDLYQEYLDQFGTPIAASNGSPAVIPTYGRNDLHYYVTFADEDVFGNPTTISITAGGIMSYTIEEIPEDFNSLINVVFVVK